MRTSLRRLGRGIALAAIATLTALSVPGVASASEPAGTAFGQTCAPVQIIAIPGSNETSDGAALADPVGVIAGIAEDVTAADDNFVRVHFIGYPAELIPYGNSRRHGYEATYSTLKYYASQCAATRFILIGYSQGAHIAGDIAATIGGGNHPVSADRVLSVRLLADPARNPDFPAVGIEGPRLLDGSGIDSVRGDFGVLNDRTTEYCADLDAVCNFTRTSAAALVPEIWSSSPHTSYRQLVIPGTNQTYTDRIASDVIQDIYNPAGVTF